jgi:translation initiation factor IF-2
LTEQADIQKWATKFGLKDDEIDDFENLAETLQDKTTLGKKKQRSRYHKRREQTKKDHLMAMVESSIAEKERLENMTEEEIQADRAEKAQLKAYFRNDDEGQYSTFYPVIVKASQAGVLETILEQSEKIIKGYYQISITDSSVGSISEADITNAQDTGAMIIGFDVQCPTAVEKRCYDAGVVVRLHKIIYKFNEDL